MEGLSFLFSCDTFISNCIVFLLLFLLLMFVFSTNVWLLVVRNCCAYLLLLLSLLFFPTYFFFYSIVDVIIIIKMHSIIFSVLIILIHLQIKHPAQFWLNRLKLTTFCLFSIFILPVGSDWTVWLVQTWYSSSNKSNSNNKQ